MSKKSKKSPKAPEAVEAPKVEEVKAPKVVKPISFPASGEVKAVKAGTKLAALIDALAGEGGATMLQLVEVLSRSGSPVDSAGVRTWISYDLKRTGLGIRQDGDRLHLVGTPLQHRDATPIQATPEAKIETAVEPKLKKAAMTSKTSRAHSASA